MTIWEWGLLAGVAVFALNILTSLMSYYHRLYRQEYLTEYLQRQHEEAKRKKKAAAGQSEALATGVENTRRAA